MGELDINTVLQTWFLRSVQADRIEEWKVSEGDHRSSLKRLIQPKGIGCSSTTARLKQYRELKWSWIENQPRLK